MMLSSGCCGGRGGLNCPAPEELTSVGTSPFRSDSDFIELKVPTLVERTIDAKARNAGEPRELYKIVR